MEDLTIILDGKTYDLACSLRVAYVIQGQHNHKPYLEIISNFDKLMLEDQVGIIYAAFKVANPFDAQTITKAKFLDMFLDNFTLKDMSEYVNKIMAGVMGTDLSEETDEDVYEDSDSDNLGN